MLEDFLQGNGCLPSLRNEKIFSQGNLRRTAFEVGTIGLVRVSKSIGWHLIRPPSRIGACQDQLHCQRRALSFDSGEAMAHRVDEQAEGVRDELSTELQRNHDLGGGVTEQMLEYLNPLMMMFPLLI